MCQQFSVHGAAARAHAAGDDEGLAAAARAQVAGAVREYGLALVSAVPSVADHRLRVRHSGADVDVGRDAVLMLVHDGVDAALVASRDVVENTEGRVGVALTEK